MEPIGPIRRDYMDAQICFLMTSLAQAIYGKRGKRKKATPLDFIPWGVGLHEDSPKPKRKQSVEEMKNTLIAIAGMNPGSRRKR